MANQDYETPERTSNRNVNTNRRLAEDDNLRASRRLEQDQIERENAALSAGGIFATILFLVVIGVGIYMFLTPVETASVASVPSSTAYPATNNMHNAPTGANATTGVPSGTAGTTATTPNGTMNGTGANTGAGTTSPTGSSLDNTNSNTSNNLP